MKRSLMIFEYLKNKNLNSISFSWEQTRQISYIILLLATILYSRPPYNHYRFERISEKPVLDLSPAHVRMTACYQDRKGNYHLFVDYIPAVQNTIHSWSAEILYFVSSDLKSWDLVETVVKRGDKDSSSCDSYGAASPGILVTHNKVLLFYAGRQCGRAVNQGNPLICEDVPEKISSRICLATADTDSNGVPVSSFQKKGQILFSEENDWDACRQDDPSPIIKGNEIWLYFKGFNVRQGDSIRVGLAKADLQDMIFHKASRPVINIPGGVEMPRVFWTENSESFGMFIRYFQPKENSIWQSLISQDGTSWVPDQTDLFNTITPGKGAADMAPVYTMDGKLAQPYRALATGEENGVLKIWALRMIPEESLQE